MTAMSRLQNAVHRVEQLCMVISSAALVLLAALMVAEVALRYLLGSPLSWSMGFITDYLMVAMFFLAISPTFRLGGHVRIDTVFVRLSPRVQHVLAVVGNVLSLLFVALLCYAGIELTADAWSVGEIPPPGGAELSWPTWTSYLFVPLGAAVLAARLVCAIVSPKTCAEES